MEIGIGSTGLCNLKCPHCYSRKYDGKNIDVRDIEKIIDIADITSVNFGTGENIFNPDFRKMLRIFNDRGVKMSLTTNGYTVLQLEDEYLTMFNDIDFSLDFPEKQSQDAYRGNGSWESIIGGLKKCKSLDINTSIACILMKKNAEHILGFKTLMNDFNSSLRINVIKLVDYIEEKKEYALNYETFWNTFNKLFAEFALISCSEPILCVSLDHNNGIKGSPCGQHTMRIQPDGAVLPCVYWPECSDNIRDERFNIDSLKDSETFRMITTVPTFCTDCIYVDICKGGCASRRILSGDINSPDEFCPLIYGFEMPRIKANYLKKHSNLVHSTYLCTIIFGLED